MIEYVTRAWNPLTGCKHGMDICPTSDLCWARGLSKRFTQICRGDFTPRLHPDRLGAPYHWRKPQRAAVCFMGDLFGDWMLHDEFRGIREEILQVVRETSRHRYLFLTKSPRQLPMFNPWPSNAWVGISITGAETPERQLEMVEYLGQVQGAGKRWVSFEPLLHFPDPDALGSILDFADWVIIGGQSGKGRSITADFGELWDLSRIAHEPEQFLRPVCGPPRSLCPSRSIPIWQKNNLGHILPTPLIQELPQ